MFDTLIVQPLFNLLTFIYAIIPGHNFGLAIILFTIIVRLLMLPLIKKQLHQVKLMRKVQPELKRIKKEAAGDRRKESLLMMELYKERGISPFGQIGVLLLQIPILIGLYVGLQKVLGDTHQIVTFSYSFIQDLSWIQQLAHNIHLFDATLFGVVDLNRAALEGSTVYWPALLIVTGSAVMQYFQSKQLSPSDKDARNLRSILRDAKEGKQADSSEMNAAMARNMRILLPALIFIVTIHLAAALALYWFVSGLVAFIQQAIILREDTNEMEAMADSAAAREKKAIEAEIVTREKNSKSGTKKAASRKKRRK